MQVNTLLPYPQELYLNIVPEFIQKLSFPSTPENSTEFCQ